MSAPMQNKTQDASVKSISDRTMTTSYDDSAYLHLPQTLLASCIFSGVERNTLGRTLSDQDRFNHYPASPLPQISWIFQGQLHMVIENHERVPSLGPALPKIVVAGPQTKPCASWSPGPVHALSVAFYPEALAKLIQLPIRDICNRIEPLEALAPPAFFDLANALFHQKSNSVFHALETLLLPLWQQQRQHHATPLLGEWIRSLLTRASFSDTGVGLRQWQRRIKQLTGQSQQDLDCFTKVEEVMLQIVDAPSQNTPPLADIAAASGFSDQSHMGRLVRRVTGASPARFLHLQQHEESFWFYRLLEGHLRQARQINK